MIMNTQEFIADLNADFTPYRIRVSYYSKDLNQRPSIHTSEEVLDIFHALWSADLIGLQEQMYALFFNRSMKLIGWRLVTTGTQNATLIDVKLICSIALTTMACSVIIAHNHPSTSLKLSKQDEDMTEKVKAALKLIEVELKDHLILTSEGGYFSMADNGIL